MSVISGEAVEESRRLTNEEVLEIALSILKDIFPEEVTKGQTIELSLRKRFEYQPLDHKKVVLLIRLIIAVAGSPTMKCLEKGLNFTLK